MGNTHPRIGTRREPNSQGEEQGHRDESRGWFSLVSGVKRGNLHPEQHQIGERRRDPPSSRVGGLSPGAIQGPEEWLSTTEPGLSARFALLPLDPYLRFYIKYVR